MSGTSWEPDITRIVAEQVQLKKGDAAANVVIEGQQTPGQGCLSAFTLGFWYACQVFVEGDVIKFK